MGGKSYYCDYCGCFLKNDVNVQKKHNEGLAHKINKTRYMRQFCEDPRYILLQEKAKLPCYRYGNGNCKFDLFCQYSHYNPQQIQELEEIAKKLELSQHDKIKNIFQKSRSLKRKLKKLKIKKLPPSLRLYNSENIITFPNVWD